MSIVSSPLPRSDHLSSHAPDSSDSSTVYFIGQTHREAPLLIYLPGLDETGQDLIARQTASLQADFNVRSLIIPATNLAGWDQLADATIALVQAERAKVPNQPIVLCAESFGGCLGLKVLEKAPKLFDQIILINPASSFHRVPWLSWGSLLLALVPTPIYQLSANWSPYFLASPDRLSPAAYQDLVHSNRSAPKQTLERRLMLMRTFSLDETQLRQVNQPILLLGSAADRILPSAEEVHRLAAFFPKAQVITLPHNGHACLIEGVDLLKIIRQAWQL